MKIVRLFNVLALLCALGLGNAPLVALGAKTQTPPKKQPPKTQTASPAKKTQAAPKTQTAAPKTQTAAPKTQTAAPKTQTAAPKAQTAAPKATAPKAQTQADRRAKDAAADAALKKSAREKKDNKREAKQERAQEGYAKRQEAEAKRVKEEGSKIEQELKATKAAKRKAEEERLAKMTPDQRKAEEERKKKAMSDLRAELKKTGKDVGMAPSKVAATLRTAEDLNVKIQLRPTNPEAVKLRQAGHPPKPESVKMKSANNVDVALGVNPNLKGQVLYVDPKTLKDPSITNRKDPRYVSDADLAKAGVTREKAKERFNQRAEEHKANAKDVQNLKKSGQVRIGPNGEVIETTSGKAYTGDNDLFNITKPNGDRLSEEERLKVQTLLKARGVDVEHGAHMHWDTDKTSHGDAKKKADADKMKEKIIDGHRATTSSDKSGEALLEVGPKGQIGRTYAPPKEQTKPADSEPQQTPAQ